MTTQTAKAESVSMESLASVYAAVQKDGGTILDLMSRAGIKNKATANQKLVKLRAAYLAQFNKELPALARCTRTTDNANGTAASRAAVALGEMFGEKVADTDSNDSDNDGSGDDN
jgi:hypothetical protein